jgi:hypothetical protein
MSRQGAKKETSSSLWNIKTLEYQTEPQGSQRLSYQPGGQRGDRLLTKFVKAGGQLGLPEL